MITKRRYMIEASRRIQGAALYSCRYCGIFRPSPCKAELSRTIELFHVGCVLSSVGEFQVRVRRGSGPDTDNSNSVL
jgi:hypothetical protein